MPLGSGPPTFSVSYLFVRLLDSRLSPYVQHHWPGLMGTSVVASCLGASGTDERECG